MKIKYLYPILLILIFGYKCNQEDAKQTSDSDINSRENLDTNFENSLIDMITIDSKIESSNKSSPIRGKIDFNGLYRYKYMDPAGPVFSTIRFIDDSILLIGRFRSQTNNENDISDSSKISLIKSWFNENKKNDPEYRCIYNIKNDSIIFIDKTIIPAPISYTGIIYQNKIIFEIESVNENIQLPYSEKIRVYNLYK